MQALPRGLALVFCQFGPLWGRRRVGAGAGRMLMRPHDGGVNRDVPVDLTRRIGGGLDLLEQKLPRPVTGPETVPFVDGLPRPVPVGQVTPLHAGPNPVQNPVDHLPVAPPPATTPITDRQERPQPFPLGIAQITPPHVHINDLDAE